VIGYMRADGHLGRNFLADAAGDAINVTLPPQATTSSPPRLADPASDVPPQPPRGRRTRNSAAQRNSPRAEITFFPRTTSYIELNDVFRPDEVEVRVRERDAVNVASLEADVRQARRTLASILEVVLANVD
jgi:hypothetical protein